MELIDASTASAGALFAENQFLVPDFQREYSWGADKEVVDFWDDLQGALSTGEYFLGLVILTRGEQRLEVVDGQQRLVTLSILANALRLAAQRLDRRLVAESIRTDFLFAIDYRTETQQPRMQLTAAGDRLVFDALLQAQPGADLTLLGASALTQAHDVLTRWLDDDLAAAENAPLRVGQWTEFLRRGLTFAVFSHPDRSAAFRVYEVVNTRGKVLTPTELIKSHVIGNSGDVGRAAAYARWKALETQLDDVGKLPSLTTFVRHVVTLQHGYVIPRDLYRVVTNSYSGTTGVNHLLTNLERYIPTYLQMLDPSADIESSDLRTRVLSLMDLLSLSRFRPLAMALIDGGAGDERLAQALETVLPGAIMGTFNTGSIEAQFARLARRLEDGSLTVDALLARLQDQRPPAEEFALRLRRPLSKQQALVVRSILRTGSVLPHVEGTAHQVRPRNAEHWPDFNADQYRSIGGVVGNWVLLRTERRPQGTRSPGNVADRLLPELVAGEEVSTHEIAHWSADFVEEESARISREVARLCYGTS